MKIRDLVAALILGTAVVANAQIGYIPGSSGGGGGGTTVTDKTCPAGDFFSAFTSPNFTCGTPVGGGGAPSTSTYITQTPDAGLANEQALSALSTGLLKSTTGTGVLTIKGANTCTNQFPRSDDASGAWTCASVNLSNDTTGTLAAGKGGTDVTSAADDTVLVGSGSAWQAKTLPSCSNATTSKLLYDTSTNTFSCGTDQTGGGGSSFSTLVLGSDVGSAVTTFSDVTGMSISVAANEKYVIDCYIIAQTTLATVGGAWVWNTPASPTIINAMEIGTTTTVSTGDQIIMQDTDDTLGSTTTLGGFPTANVNSLVMMHTVFVNGSSSGTLQLRMRAESASGTVTTKVGTMCRYHTF